MGVGVNIQSNFEYSMHMCAILSRGKRAHLECNSFRMRSRTTLPNGKAGENHKSNVDENRKDINHRGNVMELNMVLDEFVTVGTL